MFCCSVCFRTGRGRVIQACVLFFRCVSPAVIIMIDHQLCHAAIDTDILTGYESCFVGTQEQGHIGDVHRVSDTTGRLLQRVGSLVNSVRGIDSSR